MKTPENPSVSKTVSVRLPGEAIQKIDDWTLLLDMPLSEFIRQSIDTHIEHLRSTLDIPKLSEERRVEIEKMFGTLAGQYSTTVAPE